MRLFIVLSLLLVSLAGSEAQLLHTGHQSFILPVTHRSQAQQSLTLDNPPQVLFDRRFSQNELNRLLDKYKNADQLLQDHLVSAAPIVHSPTSLSSPFDVPSPASSSQAAIHPILSASGVARVPLTDFVQNALDILYYADINIGTPPQPFTVDIDTGSSDLFVPSNCADGQCGNHKQFNSHASTTFVNRGNNFKLSYGSGEAEGDLAQDVVSMQGLTVQNQSFIVVSSESSDFQDAPSDGLIGMGFSTIAVSRQPTFFENLIKTRGIAKPEFSLHLARGRVTGSELCLGCFNSAKAIGPSTYFPVVSKSYWTLKMDGLAVNGTEITADGVVAAIDSGTTLIYVSAELAASFYGLIPGSRQAAEIGPSFYAYPCDILFTPSIVFGTQNFGINMTDFNLGRLSEDSPECMGGIMALPSGFPSSLAIVGDEFLKSWYTTFDYFGPRVGFAPSVNNRK